MSKSTIVSPEMVSSILERIEAVSQKNAQTISTLQNIIQNELPADFAGTSAAHYQSLFEQYQSGAFKAFTALMEVYKSSLANATNELAMTDQEIAGRMNQGVGTTL